MDEIPDGIVVERAVLISQPVSAVWRAVKKVMCQESHDVDEATRCGANRGESFGLPGAMQMRVIGCDETLQILRVQLAGGALDPLGAEAQFRVQTAGADGSNLAFAAFTQSGADVHAIKRIMREMSRISLAAIVNHLGSMTERKREIVTPEPDIG